MLRVAGVVCAAILAGGGHTVSILVLMLAARPNPA